MIDGYETSWVFYVAQWILFFDNQPLLQIKIFLLLLLFFLSKEILYLEMHFSIIFNCNLNFDVIKFSMPLINILYLILLFFSGNDLL